VGVIKKNLFFFFLKFFVPNLNKNTLFISFFPFPPFMLIESTCLRVGFWRGGKGKTYGEVNPCLGVLKNREVFWGF